MIIEKVIIDFLKTKISNCDILAEAPARPFGRLILVQRTGGRGRFVKESTVAIQSYGASLYEAAELNEEVKDAMEQLIEVEPITRVNLNSNYNYTDTATAEHRYQAVFDIFHY
jgi:hypothetical protein